ncbi:YcgL domain-containing protein [Anaerobiospirillum succiniciproducens]|uniref:YcgL domain-containing protein n=1 Tax=Anaerobiospirillum succiniciproducens TaxID=13335 RepID=UPI002943F44A|nr:YcgL domain-containing protein [Anaerobiospirillum succiniciproducens]
MERLAYVYKSRKKLRTYLYIPEKDVFSHIPSGLMDAFGAPEFVMVFKLHKERKLPKITAEDLIKAFDEKGFMLRIDLESEEDNMLNQERARLGLPPLEREQISDYFH